MKRSVSLAVLVAGCHAAPSEPAIAPPPAPPSASAPVVGAPPPPASSSARPVESARPVIVPSPTPSASIAPTAKVFGVPEDCDAICHKAESCLHDHKLASCDDVCGGDRSPFPEYGCIATETGRSEGWECRPIVSCIKAGTSGTGRRRKGDEGRMGPKT